MAKINNDMIMGARGATGKELVYRRRNGKTFVSKYPDMSNVKPSKNQTSNRAVFSEAIKYARAILKDPVKSATFRVGDGNVYLAAIKEYMALHKGDGKKYDSRRDYWRSELETVNLTARQIKTALFMERAGRLTNGDCRQLHGISKPSATRDLQALVRERILEPSSVKGAGAFYTRGPWWAEYRPAEQEPSAKQVVKRGRALKK